MKEICLFDAQWPSQLEIDATEGKSNTDKSWIECLDSALDKKLIAFLKRLWVAEADNRAKDCYKQGRQHDVGQQKTFMKCTETFANELVGFDQV